MGDWLADRLVTIGETLQDDLPLRINTQRDPFQDERLRVANLPVEPQRVTVRHPVSGAERFLDLLAVSHVPDAKHVVHAHRDDLLTVGSEEYAGDGIAIFLDRQRLDLLGLLLAFLDQVLVDVDADAFLGAELLICDGQSPLLQES